MTSKTMPPFQYPAGTVAPSTRKAAYAEALKDAELEFRTAQRALNTDDSNEARARYAKALAHYDALQGMFPFIASGLGDEVV